MLTRRHFLRRTAYAAGALLVPGSLETLFAGLAHGAQQRARGYGPLVPDSRGLIDLPADFRYQAFSTAVLDAENDPRFSQRLSNGEPVPALHDGMAAFPGPSGMTILVRNHENEPGHLPAVDPSGRKRYDRLGTGGTTNLWLDREGRLVRSFASLSGTFRNCAGGATPWGSWLTAEECTYMPGEPSPDVHDLRSDVAQRHGYVFEVDARAEDLVDPVPITAMGRFYHEAVAVDPHTGFVYQTEDRVDGLIYRYRPKAVTSGAKRPSTLAVGDLAQGGVLEALRIVDRPSARTQHWETGQPVFQIGQPYRVDWLPIPDHDPDVDMERDPTDAQEDPLRRRGRTAPSSTRAQGQRLGAAQFARGEGMTIHGGSLYFCATSGGKLKAGQVWRLHLRSNQLSLVVESNDRALLDGPDNLMVAHNRDIIACEDGRDDQFVVGITGRGRFYPLACNALNRSEFAGACFSPDGQILYVNIQNPGITFAIRGPWRSRRG